MKTQTLRNLKVASLLVVVITMAAACEQRIVREAGWTQGVREQYAPPPPKESDGDFLGLSKLFNSDSKEPEGNWSIPVTAYHDPNHKERAEALRQSLAQSGLKDAWVQTQTNGSTVWCGHYASGRTEQARQDIVTLRKMAIAGIVPNRAYTPQPVIAAREGGNPQWDLRNMADRGRYSLQIGFYEDEVETRRMKAAEDAVKELRDKGEEAYYYHGANRSLVTIGVFDYNAIDPANNIGPQITAAQVKFPYHMANGRTIRINRGTPQNPKYETQRTFPVIIPGSIDKAPTTPRKDLIKIQTPSDGF